MHLITFIQAHNTEVTPKAGLVAFITLSWPSPWNLSPRRIRSSNRTKSSFVHTYYTSANLTDPELIYDAHHHIPQITSPMINLNQPLNLMMPPRVSSNIEQDGNKIEFIRSTMLCWI
jgi:hypothetical protein